MNPASALWRDPRKHCGRQRAWRITLPRLAEKCGSSRGLKQFKAELGKIMARDRLPEYDLALAHGTGTAREGLAGMVVQVAPRPGLLPDKPREGVQAAAPASFLTLRPRTTEQVRRAYPGYDIDALIRAWQTWTLGRGTELTDPDRAFLAFCRGYVRNHPLTS